MTTGTSCDQGEENPCHPTHWKSIQESVGPATSTTTKPPCLVTRKKKTHDLSVSVVTRMKKKSINNKCKHLQCQTTKWRGLWEPMSYLSSNTDTVTTRSENHLSVQPLEPQPNHHQHVLWLGRRKPMTYLSVDIRMKKSQCSTPPPAPPPPGRKRGKLETEQQQSVQRRGQDHLSVTAVPRWETCQHVTVWRG